MNEVVPYKQLTYKEQLEKTDEMIEKLRGLQVVSLDQFKKVRELQSTLKDRIKKQEKGEI